MDNPPISTGGIASPHDYRDDIAAASAPTTPPAQLPATLHTDLGPVLMQAKEPACVSFSVVELMRLHIFKTTGKWVDLSPRFLDILVKRYDGQDRATGGTYPRMVLKLAVQYGCATTATLPNDTTLPVLEYRDDSKLTEEVFADAAQHKIPGYLRVALNEAAVKDNLYQHGAISTLFDIGDELWTPDWADKDIDPLRPPAVIVSGHQMTDCGYDALDNTTRNHWSAAWANNGEAKYDPNAWTPFTLERWAVAEIPADVAQFLSQLPAPGDFHYQWSTNLTLGDFNDDVRFAQIALMILGFLGPLSPDELGHYGPKTAAAVGKYQQAQRINPPAPNSIGPKTRAALNAQFAV